MSDSPDQRICCALLYKKNGLINILLRLIENYGILLKYSFMLQKFDVNLVRSILLEIYVYDGCM